MATTVALLLLAAALAAAVAVLERRRRGLAAQLASARDEATAAEARAAERAAALDGLLGWLLGGPLAVVSLGGAGPQASPAARDLLGIPADDQAALAALPMPAPGGTLPVAAAEAPSGLELAGGPDIDGLRLAALVPRDAEQGTRSFRRLATFVEEAPVGIALVGLDGRIIEANRGFADLVGGEVEALVGTPMAALLHEDDRAAVRQRSAEAMAGEVTREPLEVRLAGGQQLATALFVGRHEESGELVGLVHYLTDISRRKALEAQFAQSLKMQAVGQLAGGVAHDFNNLLTAMIGFCDLLLQRHRPGDQSFADVMQIKQNANRAANLVRQLLAFSRQQTLRPRNLDIADTLAELSHLLRRLIGENIELQMVHGRDLPAVLADQGQIEQVIINLAVNARDAMPDGGTLTIRSDRAVTTAPLARGDEVMPPGDYVRIEVVDSGTGIPPEYLDRVFEPFFSTKELGSGTGLGLSTVYGIVKQTGGFVFVDTALGAGTTFSIYLPASTAEATARDGPEADDAAARAPRDLTGEGTIMLVEDEDPVRLFAARALRSKGYEVIEARTGEAALDLLADERLAVDLLVTDVVMPGIDGPTLIRAARERRPALRVICMSGYSEDALRRRISETADIHFLPKPFSLQQLAGLVKEVSG